MSEKLELSKCLNDEAPKLLNHLFDILKKIRSHDSKTVYYHSFALLKDILVFCMDNNEALPTFATFHKEFESDDLIPALMEEAGDQRHFQGSAALYGQFLSNALYVALYRNKDDFRPFVSQASTLCYNAMHYRFGEPSVHWYCKQFDENSKEHLENQLHKFCHKSKKIDEVIRAGHLNIKELADNVNDVIKAYSEAYSKAYSAAHSAAPSVKPFDAKDPLSDEEINNMADTIYIYRDLVRCILTSLQTLRLVHERIVNFYPTSRAPDKVTKEPTGRAPDKVTKEQQYVFRLAALKFMAFAASFIHTKVITLSFIIKYPGSPLVDKMKSSRSVINNLQTILSENSFEALSTKLSEDADKDTQQNIDAAIDPTKNSVPVPTTALSPEQIKDIIHKMTQKEDSELDSNYALEFCKLLAWYGAYSLKNVKNSTDDFFEKEFSCIFNHLSQYVSPLVCPASSSGDKTNLVNSLIECVENDSKAQKLTKYNNLCDTYNNYTKCKFIEEKATFSTSPAPPKVPAIPAPPAVPAPPKVPAIPAPPAVPAPPKVPAIPAPPAVPAPLKPREPFSFSPPPASLSILQRTPQPTNPLVSFDATHSIPAPSSGLSSLPSSFPRANGGAGGGHGASHGESTRSTFYKPESPVFTWPSNLPEFPEPSLYGAHGQEKWRSPVGAGGKFGAPHGESTSSPLYKTASSGYSWMSGAAAGAATMEHIAQSAFAAPPPAPSSERSFTLPRFDKDLFTTSGGFAKLIMYDGVRLNPPSPDWKTRVPKDEPTKDNRGIDLHPPRTFQYFIDKGLENLVNYIRQWRRLEDPIIVSDMCERSLIEGDYYSSCTLYKFDMKPKDCCQPCRKTFKNFVEWVIKFRWRWMKFFGPRENTSNEEALIHVYFLLNQVKLCVIENASFQNELQQACRERADDETVVFCNIQLPIPLLNCIDYEKLDNAGSGHCFYYAFYYAMAINNLIVEQSLEKDVLIEYYTSIYQIETGMRALRNKAAELFNFDSITNLKTVHSSDSNKFSKKKSFIQYVFNAFQSRQDSDVKMRNMVKQALTKNVSLRQISVTTSRYTTNLQPALSEYFPGFNDLEYSKEKEGVLDEIIAEMIVIIREDILSAGWASEITVELFSKYFNTPIVVYMFDRGLCSKTRVFGENLNSMPLYLGCITDMHYFTVFPRDECIINTLYNNKFDDIKSSWNKDHRMHKIGTFLSKRKTALTETCDLSDENAITLRQNFNRDARYKFEKILTFDGSCK